MSELALQDRLGEWLQEHRAEVVAYLQELVRIPADNPPGECAAIAERVEQEFYRFGLGVERHDVARESGVPAPTVLGWVGPPTKTPAVMLNAHVDVVPPGEGWTVDPYGGTIIDGRVFGRGAGVSKSDVAAYTYALAALHETGAVPEGVTAVAAITADEETGGAFGPGWLVSEYGLRPQRAICAGFTHGVVIAHNGCLQGKITVRGKPAHAAEPWNGTDAIRLAQQVLARIYETDLEFEGRTCDIPGITRPTLVATRIIGGGAQGVLSGSVEISIDRRVPPTDSVDEALEEVRSLLSGIAGTNGTGSIEFEPTLVVEPLRPAAAQDELVQALRAGAESVIDHELEVHGLPIFTDARWFSGAGIPVVLYGAGPRDPAEANGHAADENLRVDDLVAATEVIARAVRELVTRKES